MQPHGFQYEIPTVGQHYGNAFHLAEDDEEVTGFIFEHHHLGSEVHAIMEEHIGEDDDEEEDVEMSTTVEVIPIDPNCNYDTDDEEDDNEEEVKYAVGTEVGKVNCFAMEEEEMEEVEEIVLKHSHTQVLQNNEDFHDQIIEETVVTGNRSRSRSCNNFDCSNSTSSSSRDSSTSSTSSNASVTGSSNNSTFTQNAQTKEHEEAMSANQSQHSYHSDEDVYESDNNDNGDEDEDDEEDDPDLDFSPTKNTLWELPAKLLQDTSGPKKTKKQPPGRRKRRSSSQRQSFSMPQSPVGSPRMSSNGGTVAGLLPTSLSFDDLDSLVCDLSPTKILPIGKVSNNELEEDRGEDLLDDQLADPDNFDLAAYITGDDSTSCDTNSERYTTFDGKNPKSEGGTHLKAKQAKPVLPKSRGKEIKVLRQLMLPQEHQHVSAPSKTAVKADDVSCGKRDSATKAVRKLTMDEEESSEAEDEHIAHRAVQRVDNRVEQRRGRKRKAADDKDPTWNPNGGTGGGSKSKSEVKLSTPKPSTVSHVSNVPSSSGEEAEPCVSKPSSSMVKKGIKFGQVIKTESTTARLQPVSLAKKSLTNTLPKASTVKTMARGDHQVHTNVHRKKTNVKLDHDYCSPKRGLLMHGPPSGSIPGTHGGIASGQQRKTIEIPFLLPMKEQLKQERKLQKEKKRVDQSLPAKKHPSLLDINSATSDNGKDKQSPQLPHHRSCSGKESVSVTHNAQRIASTVIPPLSDGACDGKRTDVDKAFVNRKIVTGSSKSDCSGANETTPSSNATVGEVKKFAIPIASGASGSGVKRQISLLKVNQPTAAVPAKPAEDAGIASHVSIGAQVKIDVTTTNSGGISAASNGEANQRAVDVSIVKTEIQANVDTTSPDGVCNNSKQQEVVVRKKLNLQEYKKRREHPASVVGSGAPKATDSIQRSQGTNDRDNDSAINSISGYNSNSSVPMSLNSTVVVVPKPAEPTLVKQETTPTPQSSKSAEPLDPISAAKMKALRMQQLKKEAAIKSNEAKLSQKTFPLMPIVPLAQITSLEFDEYGNPLPLNGTKAEQVAGAGGQDALKLHPDYEEIIIVSIGCNTAVTVAPSEMDAQQSEGQREDGQEQQQQNDSNSSGQEASRLLNITDTIKRCCPSVDTLPGNSLIASIQEVVIKKSSISSSNNQGGGVGGVSATGFSQAVLVGADASVAERAVALKVEAMPVEQAAQEQYLLHQSSPFVGVSPPSSFSPGKPERAHTTNNRTAGEYAVHSPTKQSRNSKTIRSSASTASVAAQTSIDNTAAVPTVAEHGEDKVIMHLRKDRVRTQRVDATTQTDPSGRFPLLCKLAASKVATAEQKHQNGGRKRGEKRTGHRSYRRHRRRNGSESSHSDADSDATTDRPPFSRSKSHQERHRAWDRHSRSRSRSRSRHRSSRRRSSCSSGSRSRSRSGYSSRVHHSHHSQQQQSIAGNGNGCSNGSRYSRSRRKSRTCSRSSSSTSSSRYGSRSRRSLSSSSSCSSMSSFDASDGEFSRRGSEGGHHGAMRSSRSRSRSPRSRSRSGVRSNSPDRQRYHHSRDHPNQRRAISPERNIVYVGRLESCTRKEDLMHKFLPYGKIVKITLHVKANGSRYGFVTFEKPQHAYAAIDARGTDPNLRNYDVSFGGRRAFCRTQYADLDGELSNDHDHQMPYVTLDGSLLIPTRGPLPYSTVPAMCHKEPTYGGGASVGNGGGESFDDLLKKFKKEICARKT
uniref:RRM domain-containing protein n=1 Tax=Anopheles epiroticus TaxID=199890 RepID=A0A182PG81_9DIPT